MGKSTISVLLPQKVKIKVKKEKKILVFYFVANASKFIIWTTLKNIPEKHTAKTKNACILTSSFKLLTSNTVLRGWPGRRKPATPRAAAVVAAGDKAKLPRGKANEIRKLKNE